MPGFTYRAGPEYEKTVAKNGSDQQAGPDYEGNVAQNDIPALTSFNCPLGCYKEEIQNQNCILTCTSFNGLLGSDKKNRKKKKKLSSL